jgi:hypothetical protein
MMIAFSGSVTCYVDGNITSFRFRGSVRLARIRAVVFKLIELIFRAHNLSTNESQDCHSLPT